MTVVVPHPVPLEMPPGDPAALEDFVEDVAGAAYRLAVVSTCLTSPAASAPHWRGADASAAAAQVGVVASLAGELSDAVAAAAHRLRAHHDRLTQARQRVTALRAQQDEDFAVAWGRLSRMQDYQLVAMTDGPEAVGIVEELHAADAARRREHDRLLEELADDAAAAARAMADACRVVGGSGRRGDHGGAIAFLTAELPGWGDAELSRRGADLAEALLNTVSPDEREAAAREAAAYGGTPAFAGRVLAGLGEDGVRDLLTVLGDGDFAPTSALARTLAHALGAAVPSGTGTDAVGEVLAATYVDPDDVSNNPDLVALGMGIVLRAGGLAGPRPETALAWGRQMLARERAQGQGLAGSRAVDRAAPVGRAVAPTDPVGAVLQRLTRVDDPAFAAEFLSERKTWDALLSRSWDDDATSFGRLIQHAGTAVGPVGGDAARAGLEALGAELDDGDPDGWTVDRGTAAAISGALGKAVAAHVSLVAGALERAADGDVGPRDGDVLRGLGYLTLDEDAVRTVEERLHGWVGDHVGTSGAPGAPGVSQPAAAPGAFVAVREYGQRLAHALHGFEQKAAAERREENWDVAATILTLPVAPARGLGRVVRSDPFDAALDYAAMYFDCDGTWENGRDEGRRFGQDDAVRAVLRSLPHGDSDAKVLTRQAVASYAGIGPALGSPLPPTSPVRDYIGPVLGPVLGIAASVPEWLDPNHELLPEVADDINRRIEEFLHD